MKRRALFLLAVLAVPAAYALQWFSFDNDTLSVSGTIEARNINVGSKEGGRIAEVLAREGDHVEAGQVLLAFEAAELEGRLMQARGNVALARANLDKMEHGSRPEEIAEARAAAGGEREAGYRLAELAQARAELESARVELINAERVYERVRELRKQDLTAQQILDDAETAFRAARARVDSMQHAVAAAEGRLAAAHAVTDRVETGFRSEDIEAARAELLRAEGVLREAEARWAEREVRAPADAVVEVLDLRPGDLLAPGAIVAKLLEVEQLYVMVYVPETRIGRVRVGQVAALHVDTFPNVSFRARVEQIRQKAEFLPRNVQTPEERVHQVIGVKLRVEDPERRLRAGMSADVEFGGEISP